MNRPPESAPASGGAMREDQTVTLSHGDCVVTMGSGGLAVLGPLGNGEPTDAAMTELRMLSRLASRRPTRGAADYALDIAAWAESGIVGAAAWEMLRQAGNFVRKYRNGNRLQDAAAVEPIARKIAAIARPAEADYEITSTRRLASGDWETILRYPDDALTIVISDTGQVARWDISPA